MTNACRLSPRDVRRLIVDQCWRAGVGHIGSALSVADIIAWLWGTVLRVERPDDADRDRFILSKGHAAIAVYAALHLIGRIPKDVLDQYCGDRSLLGVHPEQGTPGIDFSTGSLGHGLPIGVGAALAGRMQRSSRRIIVLLSDAECNEGSTWEAVMFAAHHGLSNLVAIVDLNGQQALGQTKDILNLTPLGDRWRSFGWGVHEVDGHDVEALSRTFESLDFSGGQPHALVARTVFGKGVSFMEGRLAWHYMPMSKDEYERARIEIDRTG